MKKLLATSVTTAALAAVALALSTPASASVERNVSFYHKKVSRNRFDWGKCLAGGALGGLDQKGWQAGNAAAQAASKVAALAKFGRFLGPAGLVGGLRGAAGCWLGGSK